MFNFSQTVREFCVAPKGQLIKKLKKYNFDRSTRGKRQYLFRPGINATMPMVVCHMDTVQNGGNGHHKFSIEGTLANSIALDDRLGIASMVHAIHCDSIIAQFAMLVCDDEEIGKSTAQIFEPHGIEPNWLVELDRRGTDVVCYDYETPMLTGFLKSVGFQVGQGSFSDICYLNLGVVGFNMGVGYHDEHSNRCYANLTDTLRQLAKLEKFANKFQEIRMEHEAVGYWYKTTKKWSYTKSDVDAAYQDGYVDGLYERDSSYGM